MDLRAPEMIFNTINGGRAESENKNRNKDKTDLDLKIE